MLCVGLLFLGLSSYSQTSKIDDLLGQLKPSDPDTTQIKVLRKLSAAYTSVDPLKKFYYANQYLQLAEKNNIDSNIANAYIDMGIAYAVRSILDSGLYYFKLGNEKARAANYLPGVGRSLVNIGYIKDRQEKKQESVKNYEESLKIFKKLNNKRGINQCIMNLGSLYFDLGEYKTADIYFRQVYESVKETPNDQVGLANALFSMGGSNRKIGDQKLAFKYYQRSLAIREKLGDLNGIALSNWGMGLVLNNLNEHKKALKHLILALENNRKTKNVYQEAIVLMSLSDSYLHLENYKKAEETAKLALQKSNEANSKSLVVQSLEYLVKVEKAQKKFAEALQYQTDHIVLSDSLNSIQVGKEVILDDLRRVNTDNKNLEKSNKKITAKNNDYAIAIGIISFLLFIVAILLILYYKRNSESKAANSLLKHQKQEIAEVNEELSVLNEELKTQMEIVYTQNLELEKLNQVKNKFFSIVSHDLRGPINNLSMLFEMYRQGNLNEDELTALFSRLEDTTYTTASFLDNLLEWSKNQLDGITVNPTTVDLQQVVAHNIKLVESQIKLKSIKVNNELAEGSTVFVDLNMIHVVIRNLLSNALKFCGKGDNVTFSAYLKDDKLICTIKDTGPGISDLDKENLFNLTHNPGTGSSGEKGHHIGLILCRDMVLQNNGHLEMESKLGEGTTFHISLPINNPIA